MSTPIGRIKDTTRAAQAALVSSAVNAVMTAAISSAPFLGWTIVKPFTKFFLERVLGFLTEKGIIYFNVVWIRLEVSGEAADLEKARQKAIEAVHYNKSDEELDKLDKELEDAFKRLNRYGRGPL